MTRRQRFIWIFVLVVASIMGASSFFIAVTSDFDSASGWWEVFLGALSLPLLFYELSRLRQAVEQKPDISIGIVNINDYPLSKIRAIDSLPATINVGQGYPHVTLAIRNSGVIDARYVKIHLEFFRPEQVNLNTPIVRVYDWLGDQRYSFKQENNVDFVFIGGSDWVLHPKDTEIFSFHISTTTVIQTEPVEIRERPSLGKYRFQCSVWAEGLSSPVVENLIVNIVESIKG